MDYILICTTDLLVDPKYWLVSRDSNQTWWLCFITCIEVLCAWFKSSLLPLEILTGPFVCWHIFGCISRGWKWPAASGNIIDLRYAFFWSRFEYFLSKFGNVVYFSGYRHIPLRNECNQPLLNPSLFVNIVVKDYVPDDLARKYIVRMPLNWTKSSCK